MSVSSESLPHGPLNILIVLNTLTVLTSVDVVLHWLILFWEKKLGHQILQIQSYEIRKYFFRNRSTWRHFYSQISQIESGNQMLPYQWQKFIVKEIFVKFIFAIEDHKVNKIRRIFYFFCLSTISGKICRIYFCDWFLQSRKKGQI